MVLDDSTLIGEHHMVSFVTETALRNKQRKVRILRSALCDALVKFTALPAYRILRHIAPQFHNNADANGRVVDQAGHSHEFNVPLGEDLTLRRDAIR